MHLWHETSIYTRVWVLRHPPLYAPEKLPDDWVVLCEEEKEEHEAYIQELPSQKFLLSVTINFLNIR